MGDAGAHGLRVRLSWAIALTLHSHGHRGYIVNEADDSAIDVRSIAAVSDTILFCAPIVD